MNLKFSSTNVLIVYFISPLSCEQRTLSERRKIVLQFRKQEKRTNGKRTNVDAKIKLI